MYFHIKIRAQTCYQSHSGNGISKLENLWEILRNPSPISRFPSPKIRFSSPKIRFSLYEIRFTKIGFLLSSTAFRFLQRLSAFFNGFPIFLNGFPIFPNGFPLSKKSEKIYLRQQVSFRRGASIFNAWSIFFDFTIKMHPQTLPARPSGGYHWIQRRILR